MARLDRATNRYRVGVLRVYRGGEKLTDATIRRTKRDIKTILRAPEGAANVSEQLHAVDRVLSQQQAQLTRTITATYTAAGAAAIRLNTARVATKLRSMGFVRQMADRATHQITAGKTIGSRITTLVGAQREAVQAILTRGLQTGAPRSALIQAVEQFYAGSTGNGGPEYMARRLVTSEITRFAAAVEVETGKRIYNETKQVPVFTYTTQGDDRVRDEHEALNGTEYTLDELADTVSMEPVSKAEEALSEPNCRCFLASSFRAI